MNLRSRLKETFRVSKPDPSQSYESLPMPPASEPPCKDPDRLWCCCDEWIMERDLWAKVRDMAESDDVRELAEGAIEDYDELLEGHEPGLTSKADDND